MSSTTAADQPNAKASPSDDEPMMHRPNQGSGSSSTAHSDDNTLRRRQSSVSFGPTLQSGTFADATNADADNDAGSKYVKKNKKRDDDDDDDDEDDDAKQGKSPSKRRSDDEEEDDDEDDKKKIRKKKGSFRQGQRRPSLLSDEGAEGGGGGVASGDGNVGVTSFRGRGSVSSLKRTNSKTGSFRIPPGGEDGDGDQEMQQQQQQDAKSDKNSSNGNNEHSPASGGGNGNGSPAAGGKRSLKEVYTAMTEHEFSCGHRFFNIIHGDPVVSPDDVISSVYHTILICAIIMSIVILIVSSDTSFKQGSESTGTDTNDPFWICETISVALFTTDAILQCASAERTSDVLHLQFAFDVISVLGYYLELLVGAGGAAALVIFRIFRLTRVLRVLKVSSAANAMHLVMTTLYNSNQGMIMLISLISVVTLLGGSVVYFLELQYSTYDVRISRWFWENGELSPFQSVPETFWFVIATITTIGYGDVVPYSIVAKTATLILMLFGVLLLSFPNILIGAQFQLLHRNFQRDRARHNLGMIFRRARMVIRFVRLWRMFSVRGTINEMLDDDPLLIVPDEDEDEGDLDLYAEDEEDEEEDDDDDDEGSGGGNKNKKKSKREEERELQEMREREEERKRAQRDDFDAANLLHVPESLRTRRMRRFVNFWFFPGEYPGVDFSDESSARALQLGHFDRWWCGGSESGGSKFSALHLCHRLLENFSGCATADELFESFALYPPYPGAAVRRSDVILMLLHLAASRHLLLFVLSRTDESYVAALSKSGLGIMRTFPEQGLTSCPCFRSIQQASAIWRRTTHKPLPLDSPFGFDAYPKWQIAQALVPRVDVTNFTENLRLTQSRRNHVVFLKSGFVPQYNGVGLPKDWVPPPGYGGSGFSTAGGSSGAASGGFGGGAAAAASMQTPVEDGGGPFGAQPQTISVSSPNRGPPSLGSDRGGASSGVFHQESFAFFGAGSPVALAPGAGPAAAADGGGCRHCLHCQTALAVAPAQVPDSMWRARQEKALTDFVWKADELALEHQIEYAQNWLRIVREAKKLRLVKKPPDNFKN